MTKQLRCQTCNAEASIAAQICVMFSTITNQDNFECMKCFQERCRKDKVAEEAERDYRQEETMKGIDDYESECTYWESERTG